MARYTVISADCHAGPSFSEGGYLEYVDPGYRDRLREDMVIQGAKFKAQMEKLFAPEFTSVQDGSEAAQTGGRTGAFDPHRRLKEFEAGFGRVVKPTAAAIAQVAEHHGKYYQPSTMFASSNDRLAFMLTRNQLRAALLKRALPRRHAPLLGEIEHHFARFMGSSAKRIVRLAVKQTTYVDELYAMLSKMLDSHRDRLAFMGTREELQVVLRERAEAKG